MKKTLEEQKKRITQLMRPINELIHVNDMDLDGENTNFDSSQELKPIMDQLKDAMRKYQELSKRTPVPGTGSPYPTENLKESFLKWMSFMWERVKEGNDSVEGQLKNYPIKPNDPTEMN